MNSYDLRNTENGTTFSKLQHELYFRDDRSVQDHTFICEVGTELLRSVSSYFHLYLFLHMLVQLQIQLITNLKDVEVWVFFSFP